MNRIILEKTKRRHRQKSIAFSDELVDRIKRQTREAISLSGFIRLAVVEKLEKMENNDRK